MEFRRVLFRSATWTSARAGYLDKLNLANGLLEDDVWTDARAAKLDNLDAAISTRSTVTTAEVNTEVDGALNTAIPASNTANSVNDVLLDQLAPRLPGSGTLSTLSVTSILSDSTAFAGADIAAIEAAVDTEVGDILTDTAAMQPQVAALSGALIAVSGTVNDVGATTTSFITDLTEASDDHYNGALLVFTGGALNGQARGGGDHTRAGKTNTPPRPL